MLIFTQTVEIRNPAGMESAYSSEPVPTFDGVEWEPVPFLCSVQPSATTEGDVTRPTTTAALVLVTPPGSDIPALAATSQVRVGGVLVCDVKGEPARWPDPFHSGTVHHLEADLEVIDG